mmetsp:Transcript_36485/g.96125  ORF Transcript_36485/g.96125 Transcript_36485/m.96125 type:complete len:211 (+) Transcript_36485:1438-2070(+)
MPFRLVFVMSPSKRTLSPTCKMGSPAACAAASAAAISASPSSPTSQESKWRSATRAACGERPISTRRSNAAQCRRIAASSTACNCEFTGAAAAGPSTATLDWLLAAPMAGAPKAEAPLGEAPGKASRWKVPPGCCALPPPEPHQLCLVPIDLMDSSAPLNQELIESPTACKASSVFLPLSLKKVLALTCADIHPNGPGKAVKSEQGRQGG